MESVLTPSWPDPLDLFEEGFGHQRAHLPGGQRVRLQALRHLRRKDIRFRDELFIKSLPGPPNGICVESLNRNDQVRPSRLACAYTIKRPELSRTSRERKIVARGLSRKRRVMNSLAWPEIFPRHVTTRTSTPSRSMRWQTRFEFVAEAVESARTGKPRARQKGQLPQRNTSRLLTVAQEKNVRSAMSMSFAKGHIGPDVVFIRHHD